MISQTLKNTERIGKWCLLVDEISNKTNAGNLDFFSGGIIKQIVDKQSVCLSSTPRFAPNSDVEWRTHNLI